MVGNKKNLLSFLLLLFFGCTNNTISRVQGKFLSVTDSKPCSDSLYSEWSKGGNSTNPRYIELCYTVHNYTNEKMYLPIHTLSDSTAESSIDVYFIDETDTICPHFYVKKVPYNSNYICKGDSMMLFITISQFQKWGRKGIDVSTNLDTLINRLHVVYHKSLKDVNKEYEIPDIKFGKSPKLYYEIPRDESILKTIHADRVETGNGGNRGL